jgi:hypothetical protein
MGHVDDIMPYQYAPIYSSLPQKTAWKPVVTRFSPEERTHRPRVFQKRVFRGIFKPKREEEE